MTSTGSPSGPKARTPAAVSAAGRNQCTTLRSTRSSGASAGTSAGSQGPAASTSRFAVERLARHARRGRRRPSASQPSTGDPVAHLGAIGPRHVEQRGDAARGEQHAGARLEHGDRRRPGSAPPGCRRVTSAASRISCARPCVRALARAPVTSRPSGGPIVRPPVGTSSRAPVRRSSACHVRVGALHQRHVERVLEVGLADDPGAALRRAAGVRQRELLEAEHAPAAPGQFRERSPRPSHRGRRRSRPRSRRDDMSILEVAVECPFPCARRADWRQES